MSNKPWSPSYGKGIGPAVLAALGTREDDTLGDGNDPSPRTWRMYNAGANLMFFAFTSKTGVPISATLPGVPLGAGQAMYVNTDANQRFLVSQSTAGTTFYATPGVGGTAGGNG